MKIVEKFMQNMRRSGYDEKQRKETLKAGLLGYYRMRKREKLGIRLVNRGRKEGEEERMIKKMIGKATWYKEKKKEVERRYEMEKRRDEKRNEKRESKDEERSEGKNEREDKAKGKEEYGTVLFVPYTPRSELAKRMQKEENKFAKLHKTKKMKIVKRAGVKLISLIGGSPWKNKRCGREKCFACETYREGIESRY